MQTLTMDCNPRLNARAVSSRQAGFDMARREHYAALLRRWAHERLPANAQSAATAVEWVRSVMSNAAGGDSDRERGSTLVRLRSALLAGHPLQLRAHASSPALRSSRVEQLIGCSQLGAWERALATLPRRQRDLLILRVEFGLDFETIAVEMDFALPRARAETINALAALIEALGATRKRAA